MSVNERHGNQDRDHQSPLLDEAKAEDELLLLGLCLCGSRVSTGGGAIQIGIYGEVLQERRAFRLSPP